MPSGTLHFTSLKGFKVLFDTLYPSLCLFAKRYLNDMDSAKDLVQEVFISVWEKQPELKNQNAVKAYLYTMVKNRCLNYLHSKQAKQMRKTTSIDIENLKHEVVVLADITMVETYAHLYKAIKTLPKQTAKVIELTLKDYTTKEIAEELAITPSTVRTQKSRAYLKLKGILSQLNQFFLIF
ncbi:RNA polymerase sigma-70 factor [Tamlana fucoidanivorans]|uniref:RNA polymerase sigma-70 factor n=1 Tax=Allotamlana fucoidanivorans TaxID=2583814 RepID=A0A5C4SP91_9FLAO|nr:RNA polymerase sigma-70 factor [Tamlana fucoidanivorans]TNJ46084.1 RNA polymerase sigma-70 factor [Tamlana fucoidanivorans]